MKKGKLSHFWGERKGKERYGKQNKDCTIEIVPTMYNFSDKTKFCFVIEKKYIKSNVVFEYCFKKVVVKFHLQFEENF